MNQWKLSSLPEELKIYGNSDYVTQMRSRFIFYLLNVSAVTIVLLIAFKYITYKAGLIGLNYHLKIVIPLSFLLFITLIFRVLIKKGFINFTSQAFPLVVTIVIWVIIFTDTSDSLIRLNTVAYIFALLSLIPILVGHTRVISLLYPMVNAFIMVVFILISQESLNMDQAEVVDFLIDITVSLVFIGFVNHHIHTINKNTLAEVEFDLRKRKDVEKVLIKSENRFRELTDQLPLMICEIDLKGNIHYINETGVQMFGYSREEIAKINVLNLLPEKELVEKNMLRVIAGERKGNYYTAAKKDGETIQVQIFSSVILENNMPVGIRGIVLDVTERKNNDEVIRENEKKYRETVFLLPQTVFECDLNYNLTFLNKAGYEMLGLSSADTDKGLNIFQTILKEDHIKIQKSFTAMLKDDLIQNVVYNGKKKDGSILVLRMVSCQIKEDDIPTGIRGVIYHFADTTIENQI